jgi:pyruvate,water dikinase
VDTEVATKLLKTGEEITLDADRNVVYRGAAAGLSHFEPVEREVFRQSYEYRLLKRLVKEINQLNLLDPLGGDFKPGQCRTFHDITRYVHEKAVEALIDLSGNYSKHHDNKPKRLESDPPLGLTVIDIEDGTNAPRNAATITASQIVSIPLKAFLEGLSEAGMWSTDPVSMDVGSLMSSIARTFSSPLPFADMSCRNLVVVSREYMNLSIKLGYHFTMVDSYIGDTPNDNYVYFRFMGGMADMIRRSRRGRFIARVLEHLDFSVDVHGDLVVGRLKKIWKEKIYCKMKVIGGLIGYSRQLDVSMSSDESITRCFDDFMRRIGQFTDVCDGSRIGGGGL